jgi:uncharacterized membrane protein
MAHRWLRILRHRLVDERDAKRLLGAEALQRIAARVAESERRHSGEIRVCIEAGLPLSYLRRDAGARERAVALFGKLRVWDTEDNTGVLVYLLLAEHAIEIVADRGLNRHVDAAQWAAIAGTLATALRAGQPEAGIDAAIDALDALLVRHFPLHEGQANPNELPDEPLMR